MHKITSLAHGAVRKALGLFGFLFVLSLVLTGTASAQVVQPQYVRPSKGAPIILATVTATSVAATYTTSAIFDWSAFAGVVITADVTSGPTGTFTACRYGVGVKSLGGTSTAGNFFLLNVANNDYQAATSQSWYVRVLPTYLRFSLRTYEAAASGQPSCTYKITATPLPFDYAGQLVSTGVIATYAASNDPELPYFPAVVTAIPTFTYLRIQNITSDFARCKPVLPDGTVPNPAELSYWPIVLPPYQEIEINNWVGTIHCVGTVGIFAH